MSDKTKPMKKPKKQIVYHYITCRATPELVKAVEQFASQSQRPKTFAGAYLIEKGLQSELTPQEYSQLNLN